jgi:hypothetical protein
MPLLLRTVRRNRWFKEPAAPFLDQNDVPADPLSDLLTQQNRLSVWEVAEDHSNIERIVRAVAIGRDKIADMGYVVFASELLPGAGIEMRESKGVSPDDGANAWHRDLLVSGNKLVALTRLILLHGESGTVLEARLRQLVDEGIRTGQIPERLRAKL